MFKLSAVIFAMSFLFSSWMAHFSLPRLLNSELDYFLMPFLGYASIVLSAQLARGLSPRQTVKIE